MEAVGVQRKYLVAVLASALVGLVAFVGACALIDSTGWLSDLKFGDDMNTNVAPPIPPHWSPDGTTIILHRGLGFYQVDADSGGTTLRRSLVEGNREAIDPRISPDGTQMVFSTEPSEDFLVRSALGVANLDGSEYRRLLRSRGYQASPEWSPDGTQIAFISYYRVQKKRNDNTSYYQHFSYLYTISTKGSGPRLIGEPVQTAHFAWAPDGKRIAFLGFMRFQPDNRTGSSYIYVVDSDGSNLTRLAESSSPPTWSPDGSSIAFLHGDAKLSLFVVKSDGSNLRKIADIDPKYRQVDPWVALSYLSWSPNGSDILLQDYPFILVSADGAGFDEGKAPYAVFAGPDDWLDPIAAWSPDGSRIAVSVPRRDRIWADEGDVMLFTMARDGSDKRTLVKVRKYGEAYAVPNEPWEGEGEWVWHLPEE